MPASAFGFELRRGRGGTKPQGPESDVFYENRSPRGFGSELRRGGAHKAPGASILRIFRVQKAFGARIKRIPQGLQLLNPGGQSPTYFTSLEGPRGHNPTYSTRVSAYGEVEDRGGGKARPQGLGFYT